MLRGDDVSGVNDLGTALRSLATAQFTIVKATEGLTWNDPHHDAIVAEARRRRILVGHYHYAWPEHDPIAEAKHFLSRAKAAPGEVLALDLERESNVPWTRRLAYALAFLAYVRQATGASPLLYVNGSWIDGLKSVATPRQWAELTAYPLWYAHPGQPGVFDQRVKLWPVWTGHQYGITNLDADVFNGDAKVWAALGVPAKKPATVARRVAVAVAVVAAASGGVTAGHVTAPAPKPVVVKAAVPAPCAPLFVVAAPGDTLASLAARYHTTVAALAAANSTTEVRAGQRLRVS